MKTAWLLLFVLVTLSLKATAGTMVQFRTVFGDIHVELFDEDKPATVANFKRYIQSGLYRDSIFHRATYPPQVLVIQGGGIWVSNRASVSNFVLYTVPTYPAITNEFLTGAARSNVFGTIAMAKTTNPDSATSQFYFNLTNNSAQLDDTNNSGGFTVFGRVFGGTNVLNKLNAAHPQTGIIRAFIGPSLSEVPLLAPYVAPLDASDFVYVDITLLQVEIASSNGLSSVTWNSVSNFVNTVEFTASMPPVWQTLISTNGDGNRISVTDNTASPQRFYRVRVNY